jgi:hypothetical protein
VLGLCAAFGLIAGYMTQIKDAGDDGSPAATSDVQQDIGGGGGSNCSPPRDDCPTLPPPDCSGKAFCYCGCRVAHPCATNPSQCGLAGTTHGRGPCGGQRGSVPCLA